MTEKAYVIEHTNDSLIATAYLESLRDFLRKQAWFLDNPAPAALGILGSEVKLLCTELPHHYIVIRQPYHSYFGVVIDGCLLLYMTPGWDPMLEGRFRDMATAWFSRGYRRVFDDRIGATASVSIAGPKSYDVIEEVLLGWFKLLLDYLRSKSNGTYVYGEMDRRIDGIITWPIGRYEAGHVINCGYLAVEDTSQVRVCRYDAPTLRQRLFSVNDFEVVRWRIEGD